MQTRRDQLQAYRFQNRRALAALVTGQPNVLEPPMRRLTVTTLSGIMIAILIAIVFGILALIRPSAGTSWQKVGAVIVDQDNNATYIYTSDGTLHPAANYTSAVLAAGGTKPVPRIDVSSDDIAGATFGFEIGITDAPPTLPPEKSLIGFPMSVCSVQHPTATVGADTTVTLHLGSKGGTTDVPGSQGVLIGPATNVRGGAQEEWLLFHGQRLALAPQVAAALGYSAEPLRVGQAMFTTVPQGPTLAVPRLAGAGTTQADFTLGSEHPRIGTIVKTTDPDRAYLVLARGMVQASPFEAEIFSATRGARVLQASQDQVAGNLLTGLTPTQNPLTVFTDLPQNPPKIDPAAAQRGGVCAAFHNATGNPNFILPERALPSDYVPGPTHDSTTSQRGTADQVKEPAVAAVLATPLHAKGTVVAISDGYKYSFADRGLLSAFGYSDSDVVTVPPQLLGLLREGTGLSRAAALARVKHSMPR